MSAEKNSAVQPKNWTIILPKTINSSYVDIFCSKIETFLKTSKSTISIDFRNVEVAYPNGMLPLISVISDLRNKKKKVFINLPLKETTRKLFYSTNWAHYLAPMAFTKSESTHDRHLVTRQFTNLDEQFSAVNDFMDMVLRTISVPKDVIAGLLWSINEITDNVMNHAVSREGGYIQATIHQSKNLIAFAIVDGGRGILNSLKEGIPTLRTDQEAIGEAIKEGVTRGKEYGQGNGLAGTLRVTTQTGGSFEIKSGNGRLLVTDEETKSFLLKSPFKGTIISGQILIDENFSALDTLAFGNKSKYSPPDFIEQMYEMEDQNALFLKMKDESTGFGTRRSGFQIRTKILNLLKAKEEYPLYIDWDGVPVISSSFADEIMGKLFIEMGALTFTARIRNKGMEELIMRLLDKAISQRLTQEKDTD